MEEATPEEFDEWILQYIRIINVSQDKWPLLLRWKAINFAIDENVPLRFVDKEGKHVSTTGLNTVHEDVNPIEKEEDLPGGKEDVLRVPHGGT